MSSHRSNSMEAQDNIRKRVCKACDRCRLKKSKCDGASPCSRCKADNAICVFGERKKSQDKVYPKGYVEMLEQQQTQLVAGLRELYTRLQNGQGWPGAPLREAQAGHPLTHDILERLDLLHPTGENTTHYEGFEEDCGKMQKKLIEHGAQYTHRRGSVSSNSDHGHSSSSGSSYGTPNTKSMSYPDPYARIHSPPTPPSNSPFPRPSQITPTIKQEAPLISPAVLATMDATALSREAWSQDPMMWEEPLDPSTVKSLYGFDAAFSHFDPNNVILDPSMMDSAGPVMPTWVDMDLDYSNFVHNQMIP